MKQANIFQGKKIKILEMILKNKNDQLELSLKVYFENKILEMLFYNVSRIKMGELSVPLEVHGFEIIDNSPNGWEKDSTYEIRDFEDDYISFYCENFKIGNLIIDSE